MKKLNILMIIIALMMPMMATAATMCSKNDTITIILDPDIGGTSSNYNTTQWKWWAMFPYGTVHGTAACLSSNYGKSTGEYVADLHDNNELVVGGEANGAHCWCKMTHPAASLWGFDRTHGSASDCATLCAYYCGIHVRNNAALRSGLFGSVRN